MTYMTPADARRLLKGHLSKKRYLTDKEKKIYSMGYLDALSDSTDYHG